MNPRTAVVIASAALAASACSTSSGAKNGGKESKTAGAGTVCAKDAGKQRVARPANFPADFPLPPGTLLTAVDDRGSGGVVVTGVTATPFKIVLTALQTGLPKRGYTLTEGEVEPHDAESNWSSADYTGRWAIREIPQCSGDVLVNVVARKKVRA